VTCLSVVPPAPLAHVGGSTGYASIVVSGNTVRYSLTLTASALPPAVAEEVARVRAGRTAATGCSAISATSSPSSTRATCGSFSTEKSDATKTYGGTAEAGSPLIQSRPHG